jgi:SOS-response transcriptional repressor LexA
MITTERQPLTARQSEVLRAIVGHYADKGHPPTVRELCAVFGIRSPNGIVCHLRGLHKKGRIVWPRDTRSRAIEVVGLTDAIRELARKFLEGLTQGETHA